MRAHRCSLILAVAAAWLAACGSRDPQAHDDAAPATDARSDGAPPPIDAGVDAPAVEYVPQPPVPIPPAPPPPDLSRLPTDEQGQPIVAEGDSYYLVPRPPDALTALSDCTDMIVRCVDPAVQGRSLDACAISPPRCATAQPWLEAQPCCASACVDRYEQARTAGVAPIAAFRQAFYGRPSCAPGVEELAGGAP